MLEAIAHIQETWTSCENCFIVLGRNPIEGIEAFVDEVEYGCRHILLRLAHDVATADRGCRIGWTWKERPLQYLYEVI